MTVLAREKQRTGFRFCISATAGLILLAATLNGQTPYYTPTQVWGSLQTRAIAVSASGQLNVLYLNGFAMNVVQFAPQTSPSGPGGTNEVIQASWNTTSSNTFSMAADTVGNIYTTNAFAHDVYKNFPVPQLVVGPNGPGGVPLSPYGVGVDAAGQNIYLIDNDVSPPVIRQANAAGAFFSWTYAVGSSFRNIAVDFSGALYFGQAVGNAYTIFRLVPGLAPSAIAGNGASGVCCSGSGPASLADFEAPWVAANLYPVSDSGIYVADCWANQIYRIDQSAAYVTSIYQGAPQTNGAGTGSGAVACGIGPAVDSAGRVFFADGNGQIWQLNPSQPTTSSHAGFVTVTVGTSPSSALPFTVDGVTYSSSQTFEWTAGGSHTLQVPNASVSYPGNGTTHVSFNGWNQPLYGPSGNVYWVPTTGSAYSVTANVLISYSNEPQTITFPALSNVTMGAGPIALNATASSGLPVSYVSTTPNVCALSGNVVVILAAGTCSITASQGGNSTWAAASSITQSFTVAATAQPISITSDATFVVQVSPGSLAAIFGNGNVLATGTYQNFGLPLPLSSNGTSVTMNGISCPLLYVSATQINMQVPMEVQPGTATVIVNNNGKSFSATVPVVAAAPGFFTTDSYASGGLAIVQDNATGAVRNSATPATPGENLTTYFTGIGPVTNNPGTGNAAQTGNLLSRATSSETLTVNGVTVQPLFLGLAPGYVGLGQLNFQLPASTPSGNNIPVVLTIGGVPSKTVIIAVSGGTSQGPVISSFAANPATIQPGQSSTLSWSVANATSLSIDNGIGTVTGSSISVMPQTTTTYKLTAGNASGTTSTTATVTVSSGSGSGVTGTNTVLGPNGQKLATGQWNVTLALTDPGTNGNDNGYQLTGTATWVNASNCDLGFTASMASTGIYYYVDSEFPGQLLPSWGITDDDSTLYLLRAGQTQTYSVNYGFEAQAPHLVFVGPWFNSQTDSSQLAASGVLKFTTDYGQCTSSLP